MSVTLVGSKPLSPSLSRSESGKAVPCAEIWMLSSERCLFEICHPKFCCAHAALSEHEKGPEVHATAIFEFSGSGITLFAHGLCNMSGPLRLLTICTNSISVGW